VCSEPGNVARRRMKDDEMDSRAPTLTSLGQSRTRMGRQGVSSLRSWKRTLVAGRRHRTRSAHRPGEDVRNATDASLLLPKVSSSPSSRCDMVKSE
jgi:hypothetical protein